MKRLLLATPIALLATFGLFVFMSLLIASEDVRVDIVEKTVPVEISQTPPDQKVFERPRKLVEPAPPKPRPDYHNLRLQSAVIVNLDLS